MRIRNTALLSSQPDGAQNSRFKTLYGKPKTLSDPYDECRSEGVARLLEKPESELGWEDFNALYRAGVAPASYEEGLYFLPEAFAFLRRNLDEEAIHCVADIIWFVSEYAERLAQDGLLHACGDQVLAFLMEQTSEFKVLHWDKTTFPERCGQREYIDYVVNSQSVDDTVEALLRFKTLRGWATEFLGSLMSAKADPLRSAWYLALVQCSSKWIFFKPRGTPSPERAFVEQQIKATGAGSALSEAQARFTQEYPHELAPVRSVLEYHACVVRNAADLFLAHPTYWRDLFRKLELEQSR